MSIVLNSSRTGHSHFLYLIPKHGALNALSPTIFHTSTPSPLLPLNSSRIDHSPFLYLIPKLGALNALTFYHFKAAEHSTLFHQPSSTPPPQLHFSHPNSLRPKKKEAFQSGLFKKATKLSILCRVEGGFIIFSPPASPSPLATPLSPALSPTGARSHLPGRWPTHPGDLERAQPPHAELLEHMEAKQAIKLSILYRTKVNIIVFCPVGKPFSSGHPFVSSIFDHFLSSEVERGDLPFRLAISTPKRSCMSLSANTRSCLSDKGEMHSRSRG